MAQNVGNNPINLLDKGTLAAMNFNVLRRIDPETEKLLATAGHVTLYDFAPQEQKWARKGVEGTLFIIKRRSQPSYQYIVLNKKSQDHYVEDIHDGFKFEVHVRDGVSYLLYKNRRGEVVGIWFYDNEECAKVVLLLEQLASEAAQPSGLSGEPSAPQQHPLLAAMLAHSGGSRNGGESAAPAAAAAAAPRGDSFWDQASGPAVDTSALLAPDGSRPAQPKAPLLIPSSVQTPPTKAPGEQNPLEKLFLAGGRPPATPQPTVANLPQGKSSEQLVAAAVSTSPLGAGGRQASAPVALLNQPGLLKPSFFQQSPAPPQEAADGAANGATPMPTSHSQPAIGHSAGKQGPASTPANNPDALLKLFSKTASPAAEEAAEAPEASKAEAAPLQNTNNHALIRSTVKALANSDEFIELLVRELQKSGVLQ